MQEKKTYVSLRTKLYVFCNNNPKKEKKKKKNAIVKRLRLDWSTKIHKKKKNNLKRRRFKGIAVDNKKA